MLLKSHPKTQPQADVTVAHARLVAGTPVDQLIDETVSLFQTAHLGIAELPVTPPSSSAGKP